MESDFIEIRDYCGRLLLKYDPTSRIIRIKPKGGKESVIDLKQFPPPQAVSSEQHNTFVDIEQMNC
jgi:hypothetical protein